MLIWCAYCQHFLGEKQPYENLEMTHSICEKCCDSGKHKDRTHIKQIQPIIDFYLKIRDQAVKGEDIAIEDVIAESQRLGISSVDMAIGILQPILNEMGQLNVEGKVTVAQEHAFTDKVDRMITNLFALSPAMKNCRKQPPIVILTCVEGNYHWLGLRLLELGLLQENIPTRAFIPSLPREEIIRLAAELRPIILGLSVYERAQCAEALKIREGILNRTAGSYAPKMAVGGNGVKKFLEEKGVEQWFENEIGYFRQALDFVEYMKSRLPVEAAS